MSCNKIPAAVITPVLAAGAVSSPYFVAVNHFAAVVYSDLCRKHPCVRSEIFIEIRGAGRYGSVHGDDSR